MDKQYKALTNSISAGLKQMRHGAPEAMQAFAMLSSSATKDGVLDKKTKELIALALGVAAHCDGCIGFHTQTLVKLGVSKQALIEALGMAVYMGGGPSLMYAADAITAYDQASASLPNN